MTQSGVTACEPMLKLREHKVGQSHETTGFGVRIMLSILSECSSRSQCLIADLSRIGCLKCEYNMNFLNILSHFLILGCPIAIMPYTVNNNMVVFFKYSSKMIDTHAETHDPSPNKLFTHTV